MELCSVSKFILRRCHHLFNTTQCKGRMTALVFIVLVAVVKLAMSVDVDHSDLRKVGQVGDKYLSFGIGGSLVARRWENFDFDSARLRDMARSLSPAYFRYVLFTKVLVASPVAYNFGNTGIPMH